MLQELKEGQNTLAWEWQEYRVGAGWAGKGNAVDQRRSQKTCVRNGKQSGFTGGGERLKR